MAEDQIQDVEGFLEELPKAIGMLCKQLRTVVTKSIPDATEIIAHGALGYAISNSAADRIIYIAPQQRWVNLGFFFGTGLNDPGKWLQGTGTRMRHIKISKPEDINHPEIKALIEAAWAKGPANIAAIRKRRS